MTKFLEITNQDIYEEIKELRSTVSDVLAHAKLTNGRVTKLEKRSFGLWISNNPLKFTLFIVAFSTILMSSEELIDLLKIMV